MTEHATDAGTLLTASKVEVDGWPVADKLVQWTVRDDGRVVGGVVEQDGSFAPHASIAPAGHALGMIELAAEPTLRLALVAIGRVVDALAVREASRFDLDVSAGWEGMLVEAQTTVDARDAEAGDARIERAKAMRVAHAQGVSKYRIAQVTGLSQPSIARELARDDLPLL